MKTVSNQQWLLFGYTHSITTAYKPGQILPMHIHSMNRVVIPLFRFTHILDLHRMVIYILI